MHCEPRILLFDSLRADALEHPSIDAFQGEVSARPVDLRGKQEASESGALAVCAISPQELISRMDQDLIKGSYSTMVHVLGVFPQPSHGVIRLSADNKVKLFLKEPIGDIQAATIELTFNTKYHLSSGLELIIWPSWRS